MAVRSTLKRMGDSTDLDALIAAAEIEGTRLARLASACYAPGGEHAG